MEKFAAGVGSHWSRDATTNELSYAGNLEITPTSGSDDAFIHLRTGSGSDGESGLTLTESTPYGYQIVHSVSTDLLKFKHQNANGIDKDNILVFDASGKIGVNTSSPKFKLEIGGDDNHLF